MKDTPWDHGLRVSAEDGGLVGHAGAVLLRKLADRAGLTAALGGPRWRGRGSSRWWTAAWHWFPWRWRSRWGPPA